MINKSIETIGNIALIALILICIIGIINVLLSPWDEISASQYQELQYYPPSSVKYYLEDDGKIDEIEWRKLNKEKDLLTKKKIIEGYK